MDIYASTRVRGQFGSILAPTPHQRVHLRVLHHQPSGTVKALPFLHEKVDVLRGYGGEVHLARIPVAYGAHSTTYQPPINHRSTSSINHRYRSLERRTKTAFTPNIAHQFTPNFAASVATASRREANLPQNINPSTKFSPTSASREGCLLIVCKV